MIEDFEKVFPEDAKIIIDIFKRANATEEEIEQFANVIIKMFAYYGYSKGVNENV